MEHWVKAGIVFGLVAAVAVAAFVRRTSEAERDFQKEINSRYVHHPKFIGS